MSSVTLPPMLTRRGFIQAVAFLPAVRLLPLSVSTATPPNSTLAVGDFVALMDGRYINARLFGPYRILGVWDGRQVRRMHPNT